MTTSCLLHLFQSIEMLRVGWPSWAHVLSSAQLATLAATFACALLPFIRTTLSDVLRHCSTHIANELHTESVFSIACILWDQLQDPRPLQLLFCITSKRAAYQAGWESLLQKLTQMFAGGWACAHAHTRTHMHACTHAQIISLSQTHTYTCVHAHTVTHVHTYTHIQTHTQTLDFFTVNKKNRVLGVVIVD